MRAVAGLLALLCFASAFAADPLPALHAEGRNVTASGVSAGGYMAVQFHVAHSASVSGVGVIAGGRIDPTANLARARAWLFSGTNDHTVYPEVVAALRDFYAGHNAWADSNALIVLYPQVIKRYSPFMFNPRGCWDWWGYTGADYATNQGARIRAVKAMVEALGR